MAYNCGNCQSEGFACTGWDGKGTSIKVDPTEGEMGVHEKGGYPNHNLLPICPSKTDCQYRLKKTHSPTVRV